MPPSAATTGVAARRAELSAPPGAVASTTSLVASAKKKTMPTSLTRKRSAPATRAYESLPAFAQIRPATAPTGRSSERSMAVRTSRWGRSRGAVVMSPRRAGVAFSSAADLQPDRRADEAEAVADLVDEEPFVGEMKRGRDV